MDKTFLRNFLLLASIVIACVGVLSYSLISGEKEISRTDDLVVHSYDVITKSEQLSTLIETMLAAQRGYILSGQKDFQNEYEIKKTELSDLIADLSELTNDNARQGSRIDELRHHVNVFSDRLEQKSRLVKPGSNKALGDQAFGDLAAVNDARINIRRINTSILKDEYDLLKKRIGIMENRKHQYFNSLLIGGIAGGGLLLIINGFLFQAQRRRTHAEQILEDSRQRFAMALEGSNDGIYDWDITNNKVFYSKQFFVMLGYTNKDASEGVIDDSTMLIHPDDVKPTLAYREKYLRGEIKDYNSTFRMRHANGTWMWINARGKALFDQTGTPLRMVGAHSDITYLKESQERLQREKDLAEQANRAKSDFLAHMSHEIRTPLTAISGIAEILDKAKSGMDTKQQKLISTLGTSTSSLKDLISDILDFSKIESGELELDVKPFNLSDLFEQVISIMSVRAHEKKLLFTFEYPALNKIKFLGDMTRLRQILINLISNALKFSDKGKVEVYAFQAEIDGNQVLKIQVKDSGIGISEDKFGLIFERFKQADSSVSRKYGGTGLGLPISKNLAKMMGGDIQLESRLGEGSTFTLIVPFTSLEEAGQSTEKSSDILLEKKEHQKISGERRALLVEDYEGNILVIGYILEEMGLPYDVAKTGVEALDLWRQNAYNVILMDVQMPEMDGLTASKTIRSMELEKSIPRTPIIGMTAHALVADKDKCIEAGMDAYLPKPIVEDDLKNQIMTFIENKQAA